MTRLAPWADAGRRLGSRPTRQGTCRRASPRHRRHCGLLQRTCLTVTLLLIGTTLVTPIDNHPHDSPSKLTVINRVSIVQFTVIIVVMNTIR